MMMPHRRRDHAALWRGCGVVSALSLYNPLCYAWERKDGQCMKYTGIIHGCIGFKITS